MTINDPFIRKSHQEEKIVLGLENCQGISVTEPVGDPFLSACGRGYTWIALLVHHEYINNNHGPSWRLSRPLCPNSRDTNGTDDDRTLDAVSTVIHRCGTNNVVFNAIENTRPTDTHHK